VVRKVRLVRMAIDAAGRVILEKASAGGNALGRWSGVVFGSSFGATVLAAGPAMLSLVSVIRLINSSLIDRDK
jgi:hypothetical protein